MGSVVSTIVPVALNLVAKGDKQGKQESVQRQEIQVQAQADEERRQRALKSAVATQRARFGASGIDSTDGSAEAVLLGLFETSEEEAQARLERDEVRMQAASLGRAGAGRNLLDLTESVFSRSFSNIFLS